MKENLVTGDSSIYGWGVQDHQTYAVNLEKELKRIFRFPIEVINLGVPVIIRQNKPWKLS